MSDVILSYKKIISQLDNQINKLKTTDNTPIGTITPFGGNTIPSGWLECNGAAVSRTVYAQLYSIIGTTFGSGDGSTTFNLPNISGKTLVGQQASDTDFDTLGDTGGEKTHKLTVAEMPNHNHVISDQTIRIYAGAEANKGTNNWGWASYLNMSQMIGAVGGDQSHNNMQPYIVTKFIIKATSESGDVPVSPTIEQRIAAIEGQISRVENYSTQEQVIGTWIDEKPLYRKCFSNTQTDTSQTYSLDLPVNCNITYTDVRLCRLGTYTNNSNTAVYYQDSTDYMNWYWSTPVTHVLVVRFGSSWPLRPAPLIIIVEYTKTTD